MEVKEVLVKLTPRETKPVAIKNANRSVIDAMANVEKDTTKTEPSAIC